MSPTIYDLVKSEEIAAYIANAPSNGIPYLGASLFPPKKQLGLDLSWIKGSNGLPVALKPSAFDAKAPVRDRIGFAKIETEMPFFREAMVVKEKDRQQLNMLLGGGQTQYAKSIITKIFDDAKTLVDGAKVQPERMIMQLLSKGTIHIQAEGVLYDYDYRMPADHKETLLTGAKWNESGSNPVEDIIGWMDTVEEDTGTRPTAAICSRKTFSALAKNETIRKDMNPVGYQNIIVTDNQVRQYFQTKLNLSIAVYNKKYKAEDGTTQNFFADDVFTLIPPGTLGNTWYGTTPEESDLMGGGTNASVSIVDTGVAVTTLKIPHPVNVETIVSEIVLPSFEKIDEIFIATVL